MGQLLNLIIYERVNFVTLSTSCFFKGTFEHNGENENNKNAFNLIYDFFPETPGAQIFIIKRSTMKETKSESLFSSLDFKGRSVLNNFQISVSNVLLFIFKSLYSNCVCFVLLKVSLKLDTTLG